MVRRSTKIRLTALVLSLALGACVAPTAPSLDLTQEWLDWRPAHLPVAGTVEVVADAGLLRVHEGTELRARVLVEAPRRDEASGRPDLLSGLRFAPSNRDPGLALLAVCTDHGAPPSVHIDLFVPRGTSLEVRGERLEVWFDAEVEDLDITTSSGRMRVAGSARRCHLESRCGSLEVEGRFEELSLVTLGGPIELDMERSRRSLRSVSVSSEVGLVEVSGPDEALALMAIQVRPGDLRLHRRETAEPQVVAGLR